MNKAIQIQLGEGKVAISHFSDNDGHGLMFRDTGQPHTVGDYTGEPEDPAYLPQPGEIYIKCATLESANVLREMAEEMCARFTTRLGQAP